MNDQRKELLKPLASNLVIAYLKTRLGVTWVTAEKYNRDNIELGELWFFVADFIEESLTRISEHALNSPAD